MNINFTCDECPFTVPNRVRLKSHKLSVHSDARPWGCTFPGCNFTAKWQVHLKRHLNTHESNPEVKKPFLCKFINCEYRAARKCSLERHIKANHTSGRSRPFQCTLCSSRFYTKANLNGHIDRHVKESRFRCDRCEFSSHDKLCLTRHVKSIHDNGSRFHCSFPGCNYSGPHPSYVQKHQRSHNPDPSVRYPFQCSFTDCDFRSSRKKDLKKHINARHNPNRTKEFTCPLCSKGFYSSYCVKAHIQLVHTKEKTFSCDQCSFKTHYANGLKAHGRTEHGIGKAREEKFKCDFCEHRAYSRPHLELHKSAKHTMEKEFVCDFPGCGYTTSYVSGFKHHRLIHEQDPEKQYPFACAFPGCDFRRRFRTQIQLHEKRHSEINSGRELFKCDLCTKNYPDKVSLDFHDSMIHKTESYKCSQCSYTTRIERNLWQHSRHHHRSRTSVGVTKKVLQMRKAGGSRNSREVTCRGQKFRAGNEIVDMSASVTQKIPVVILQKIRIKIL